MLLLSELYIDHSLLQFDKTLEHTRLAGATEKAYMGSNVMKINPTSILEELFVILTT